MGMEYLKESRKQSQKVSEEHKIKNQEEAERNEKEKNSKERAEDIQIDLSSTQRKTIENELSGDNPQQIDEKRASLNVFVELPYDCVVNVGLICDITERDGKGWPILFSKSFYETLEPEYKNQDFEETKDLLISSFNSDEVISHSIWTGAVVAIVGLYDKGKTFVLNNLTDSKLPSSKRVHTEGLSFKHAAIDGTTNIILLDTAGSFSPVKIENENSISLKEQSENFILDTVFELSDYFICVVNDYTSLDQKFLDKIVISLQNTPKNRFKEVIVVHNLKDVTDPEEIDDIWNFQVTQIYPGSGNGSQITRITAVSARGEIMIKDVKWFKTEFTRHVFLANNDSPLGREINPWTFALLKDWLKSIFVSVDKNCSVVKSVLNNIQEKLRHYFDNSASVRLEATNDVLKKIIKSTPSNRGTSLQPLGSSPFIITSPNNFVPLFDKIEDRDEYKIIVEIPGLSEDDINIKRHQSTTIVRGTKKRQEEADSVRIVQSQRKFGLFEISFKIPEDYIKRWDHYEVKDGILTITYKKDEDD